MTENNRRADVSAGTASVTIEDIGKALAEGFQMDPIPPQLEPLLYHFGGEKIFGVQVPAPPLPPGLAGMPEEKLFKLLAAMRRLMRECANAERKLGPDASKEEIHAEVAKSVSRSVVNAHRKVPEVM